MSVAGYWESERQLVMVSAIGIVLDIQTEYVERVEGVI